MDILYQINDMKSRITEKTSAIDHLLTNNTDEVI